MPIGAQIKPGLQTELIRTARELIFGPTPIDFKTMEADYRESLKQGAQYQKRARENHNFLQATLNRLLADPSIDELLEEILSIIRDRRNGISPPLLRRHSYVLCLPYRGKVIYYSVTGVFSNIARHNLLQHISLVYYRLAAWAELVDNRREVLGIPVYFWYCLLFCMFMAVALLMLAYFLRAV